MPRKRFVVPAVLTAAKEYLGTDATYREVVRHDGRPVQYVGLPKDPLPAVAPSTVWHWLSWLGNLPRTLRAACDLIQQKEPGSTLHREPCRVPATKYRSEQRRQTLQRAMRLVVVDAFFAKSFGRRIFPCFATAHGFR